MSDHRRAYRRVTKALRLAQSGEADSIVAAAKEILATRMMHGDILAAPGAVREYLRSSYITGSMRCLSWCYWMPRTVY